MTTASLAPTSVSYFDEVIRHAYIDLQVLADTMAPDNIGVTQLKLYTLYKLSSPIYSVVSL